MQLHKSHVLATATEVLDNYGIADLTMRRLARELDVSPGALYWHFANKQQLLGAVADEVLRPALTAATSADWRVRVEESCRAMRDALLSHTDGAELVSSSFAAGQSTCADQIADQLAIASRDAGLTPPHDGLAARTVLYYVLGFVVDEQSRMQFDAAGAVETDLDLDADPSARFEFGLHLLIDGIAAQQALPASTNSSR